MHHSDYLLSEVPLSARKGLLSTSAVLLGFTSSLPPPCERALKTLNLLIGNGVQFVRTHADTSDPV